jgi:hypothetical protein
MRKFKIYFLLIFILTGCADYKWGSRWKVSENTNWTNLPRRYQSVLTQTQCYDNSLTLSINKYNENTVMALLFIPLSIRTSHSQTELQISIDAENIAELCSQYKNNMFEIILDGNNIDNFNVTTGKLSNMCFINFNIPQADNHIIQIRINKEFLDCDPNVLEIHKSSYFCIKATKFGGSDYCDY